jgi:hypothetical protein
MPKGVEHKTEREKERTEYKVDHPLMPKGVEHQNVPRGTSFCIDGRSSVDAERR